MFSTVIILTSKEIRRHELLESTAPVTSLNKFFSLCWKNEKKIVSVYFHDFYFDSTSIDPTTVINRVRSDGLRVF